MSPAWRGALCFLCVFFCVVAGCWAVSRRERERGLEWSGASRTAEGGAWATHK